MDILSDRRQQELDRYFERLKLSALPSNEIVYFIQLLDDLTAWANFMNAQSAALASRLLKCRLEMILYNKDGIAPKKIKELESDFIRLKLSLKSL